MAWSIFFYDNYLFLLGIYRCIYRNNRFLFWLLLRERSKRTISQYLNEKYGDFDKHHQDVYKSIQGIIGNFVYKMRNISSIYMDFIRFICIIVRFLCLLLILCARKLFRYCSRAGRPAVSRRDLLPRHPRRPCDRAVSTQRPARPDPSRHGRPRAGCAPCPTLQLERQSQNHPDRRRYREDEGDTPVQLEQQQRTDRGQ